MQYNNTGNFRIKKYRRMLAQTISLRKKPEGLHTVCVCVGGGFFNLVF